MKIYGGVQSGKRKNWLHFGSVLGLLRGINEQKAIIFVAYPEQGVGNDPKALRSAFHQGPTFIK